MRIVFFIVTALTLITILFISRTAVYMSRYVSETQFIGKYVIDSLAFVPGGKEDYISRKLYKKEPAVLWLSRGNRFSLIFRNRRFTLGSYLIKRDLRDNIHIFFLLNKDYGQQVASAEIIYDTLSGLRIDFAEPRKLNCIGIKEIFFQKSCTL